MIQIVQLKLNVGHSEEDLKRAIQRQLKLAVPITEYKITKKSIDARKKMDLKYIYTIQISISNEKNVVRSAHNPNVSLVSASTYHFPIKGTQTLHNRPVIIGTGPAGLFCGLMLAKAGYAPILLERGAAVEQRVEDVEQFFVTNQLNPNSNIQFGEGGAGTFSDGKLNTLVKDKFLRNQAVLETFVQYGAPSEILYLNKPHIGTDLLRIVVKNMREDIIAHGGEVRFHAQVTDFLIEKKQIIGVKINDQEQLLSACVVIAIGHSARDTFECLYQNRIMMESKAFAIGLRIEHSAQMIKASQYGTSKAAELLPAADYKLTHRASNGRNIYSFCMCPGGFVVNSSSEPNRITVNGMSNHARDERNSNSALIVNVTPKDFAGESPLAGIEFQRYWEAAAYKAGQGKIPVQLLGDFKDNCKSTGFGEISPSIKGLYTFGNLNECLPSYVNDAIIEGVFAFEHKIKGFSRSDSILSGIEARTSSPIRVNRDELFQSNIRGLYPCGEGAGYAGGITSAAMDGIKIAEAIASQYKPIDGK